MFLFKGYFGDQLFFVIKISGEILSKFEVIAFNNLLSVINEKLLVGIKFIPAG